MLTKFGNLCYAPMGLSITNEKRFRVFTAIVVALNVANGAYLYYRTR